MLKILEDLILLARERKKNPIEGSYTNKLLENKNLAKDKVLEEVNELIEAVEVTTEDTKYLVKVSTKLAVTMENYDEDDYDDYGDDDPEAVKAPEDINDDVDLGD